MSLVSQKIRDSAEGQPCMLRTYACNDDWTTTVACHGPSHLKGMGNKSPDTWISFGCSGCHPVMDQHMLDPLEELQIWHRAILDTQMNLIERGLIVVSGHQTRASGAPPKKHKGKIPKRQTQWPKQKLQSRPFNNTRNTT